MILVRLAALVLVAAVTGTVGLAAGRQDPPVPQSPPQRPEIDATATRVFKSRSDMVVLHVNVFDKRANPVAALSQANFMVFEDGRNQEISFFSNEDVPVAAGLVIDNSSSMIAKGDMAMAGAMAFANTSHPQDELFTVQFNEHVGLGLPPQFMFTSSRALLRSALVGLRPGGKTALHDAVITALDHVERASHQKHVIIVLSDGEDTASRHEKDEMYERAMKSDALIYAVGTNDPRFGGDGSPGVLRHLAKLGGGAAYMPRTKAETVAAFTEIATNIRRGYSIGYTSTNTARDGSYRQVKVMVRANGQSFAARCRDGYTAPGHASTR